LKLAWKKREREINFRSRKQHRIQIQPDINVHIWSHLPLQNGLPIIFPTFGDFIGIHQAFSLPFPESDDGNN